MLTLLPTAPACTDLNSDHNKSEQTLLVLPSSVCGVRSQDMKEDPFYMGHQLPSQSEGFPALNLTDD